jgi:hypothetical protein
MGSDMYVCGFHGEERESRLNKKVEELQSQIAALEEVERWRVLANTALASLESSQLINEISERYEIPRPEGE